MGNEGLRNRPQQEVVINSNVIKRSDFGPGDAGERSWNLINNKATCEAIVGGKKCGLPAIQVLNYDVLGDLECLPICGDEHCQEVRTTIERELESQGRSTAFGINGWGRS